MRASDWQPKLLLGLWSAGGLIMALVILDWAWTLFQFFFPARFEKTATPSLVKLSETQKSVSYEELQKDLIRRNLFSKTLPKVDKAPASTLDSELARFKLIGVLSGQNKRAIFRDKNNQQSLFVNQRSRVGNLEVKEIREKSVVVARDEQQKEIFVEK